MSFEKVRRNVEKMLSVEAPEADIDAYLESEGFTPETFKAQATGGVLAPSIQKSIAEAKARVAAGTPVGPTAAEHYDTLAGPGYQMPYAAGVAGSIAKGGTFGGIDELAAGADSLRGRAPYNDALAIRRDQMKQFEQENPVVSTGAEILGALPTAAVPFLNGPRAATLAGRMGVGALTAGGQGAAYGFNTGEGGGIERGKDALTTAAITAPLGAAAPAVGAGAKSIKDYLMTRSVAKELGTTPPVYQIVRDALDADGALSGAGARNIRNAGPGAMVADAGPGTKGLLDAAVNRPGVGAAVARRGVEKRAAGAGRSLDTKMNQVLGPPRGPRATARDISKTTAPARKAAYDAAFAKPIDYASEQGRNIESALSRIPENLKKAAFEEANDAMKAGGVKNMQILFDVADNGAVTLREMPNVQQLNEVKIALGTLAQGNVDQFGRMTAAGNRAAKLARELKTATGEAVPEYLKAVRLGGDKIERDNALKLGRQLLSARTTREMVEEGTEDLSEEAADALKTGIRGHIDDMLANVKQAMTDPNIDAREAYKAVQELTSRANKQKMTRALGEKGANDLYSEVQRAQSALGLRAAVAQNSKTAPRQIIENRVKDMTDEGVINKVRGGHPVQAGQELAQILMRRTPGAKSRIEDETYSGIVDFLTGPRGPEARQAILAMEQAAKNQGPTVERAGRLAEMLGRRNTAVSAPLREKVKSR